MTDITGATLLAKVVANTIAAHGSDPITDDKYMEALCDAISEEVNAWISTNFDVHTHTGINGETGTPNVP
jgi:hypothetical protein